MGAFFVVGADARFTMVVTIVRFILFWGCIMLRFIRGPKDKRSFSYGVCVSNMSLNLQIN